MTEESKESKNKPPTKKQLKYITKLQREIGMPLSELEILKKRHSISNVPHPFSSISASAVIQELQQSVKSQRSNYGRKIYKEESQ